MPRTLSNNMSDSAPSSPAAAVAAAPKISIETRAGLTLPVQRVKKLMRARFGKKVRIGQKEAITLASVLEYLFKEVVEGACNHAKANNQPVKGTTDRFVVKRANVVLFSQEDSVLARLQKSLPLPRPYGASTLTRKPKKVVANKKVKQ